MARGFGSTLGSGTTDVVSVANYAAIQDLTTFSVALWVNRRAAAAFSTLITKMAGAGGPSAGDFRVFGNNASGGSNTFEAARWATTIGIWTYPQPSLDAWHHLVVVYDYGATTNNPVIYVDGVSQTVTPTSTPVGTLASTSQPLLVCNRPDGLRVWDGQIGELAIWSALLDAGEAAALGAGYVPSLIRPGKIIGYWPLIGRASPEVNAWAGSTGTLTGTLVRPHPRVLLPRRVYVTVSATAVIFIQPMMQQPIPHLDIVSV